VLSLKEKIDDLMFLLILIVVAIASPIYIFRKHILGSEVTYQTGLLLWLGIAALVLSAIIVLTNLYLVLIRSRRLSKNTTDVAKSGYVSPLPIVGSLTVVASSWMLDANLLIGFLLLILFLSDPGGIVVMLIALGKQYVSDALRN